MSLIPWKRNHPNRPLTPVQSPIQQDVQRMFDRFFNGLPAFPGLPEAFVAFPAVNVSDTGDSIVVKAEVPGLDADDLEVNIEGALLTLKGEKKEEREETREDFYHVERSFGGFMRRIELPCAVDSKRTDAKIERGVLILRMPKSGADSTRAIKIQRV